MLEERTRNQINIVYTANMEQRRWNLIWLIKDSSISYVQVEIDCLCHVYELYTVELLIL
jgi:hypothetical protein